MVRKRNSVFTYLLQKKTNLQLQKCMCHSIELCISKRNLELLASHSHNCFSNSVLCWCEYAKIQSHHSDENPLKLLQMYMVAFHPWLLFAHIQSVGSTKVSNQRPSKIKDVFKAVSARIQQDQQAALVGQGQSIQTAGVSSMSHNICGLSTIWVCFNHSNK